jgi:hypothetical protein
MNHSGSKRYQHGMGCTIGTRHFEDFSGFALAHEFCLNRRSSSDAFNYNVRCFKAAKVERIALS